MTQRDRLTKDDRRGGANTAKCPTCGAAVDAEDPVFPFCSDRCQKVDLGRWFNEAYTVSRPIEQADLEEDD